MCGIVGVAGKISPREEKIFEQLLIVDTLRGVDSTGVAIINRDHEVTVIKEIGLPHNVIESRHYERSKKGFNSVLIGHNRYATSGNISRKTAHPFEFDNVVGVHNGTLTDRHKLDKNHTFTVDSESLYHHIDAHGIKDAMTKIKGAWSLVWWDKVHNSLNFLRNNDRPMHICRSKDLQTMYWASEAWMLWGILGRNGVDFTEIETTTVDTHYSVTVDSTGGLSKAKISHCPSTYVPAYVDNNYGFPHGNVAAPVKPAVVAPVKKKGVIPLKITHSKGSYNPLGHVKLKIIGVFKDQFQSTYFECVDEFDKDVDIRLYFTRLPEFAVEAEDLVGGQVIGQINPIATTTQTGEYYKVIYSSVNWDDLEYDIEVNTVFDHNNKPMERGDWVMKYGTCCFCGDNVTPEKPHSLTKSGDSLCSSCCTDPSVLQYVSIAGGVRSAV